MHKLMTSKGALDVAFLLSHAIGLEAVNNICKAGTLEGGSMLIDGVGVRVPAHTLPCYQL